MSFYFQANADASREYRPTSAAGPQETSSAAVSGNLADLVKNSTVYRVQQSWPNVVVHVPETTVNKIEKMF